MYVYMYWFQFQYDEEGDGYIEFEELELPTPSKMIQKFSGFTFPRRSKTQEMEQISRGNILPRMFDKMHMGTDDEELMGRSRQKPTDKSFDVSYVAVCFIAFLGIN